MLYYRIETPVSGCKYVNGEGIISRYDKAHGRSTPSDHEITRPAIAQRHDALIQHLYGDHVPTPYVSVTVDFFRALSIVSQSLRKAVDVNNIWLIVISSNELDTPPVDACKYLRDIPHGTRQTFEDYHRMYNAVCMNSEYLVISFVPNRAIRARLRIGELLDYLPIWLLDAERKFIVPAKRKSVHRTWIKAAKKRYKVCKAATDTREPAVRLANKLRLREEEESIDFVKFVMTSPRVVCDTISTSSTR